MSKTIDTLVADIENVILGLNGWDEAIGTEMGHEISKVFSTRFGAPQEPRDYLSMSSMGTDCDRKLWYKINKVELAQPLRPNSLLKFSYGDMLEELILCLAMQAGHTVVGQQDRMSIHGLKGSRDAVIDGMSVDVKSASPAGFKKFKEGNLRNEDPFGYISQLSSYVASAQDDPLVTNKTHGAFLVIDKVHGHLCLDVYDFSDEIKNKKSEIEAKQEMVKSKLPPPRGFDDEPQSKTSPNRKLGMQCSFCEFKRACWPGLKIFNYSYGPMYITELKKKLRVEESDYWP